MSARQFTVCQIKGCDRPHNAQAFCRLHHERWLKHGHPLKTLAQISPEKLLKDRFYSNVSLPNEDGCMLWTGTLVPKKGKGYGVFSFAGIRVYAHRLAYELLVGPIPEGLQIDHVKAWGCRSTACCNPDHLEPVTQEENLRRSDGIGQRHARKTHCVNNHPFSKENTRILPNGSRQCRQCRRDYANKYRNAGYQPIEKDVHA
jgi:hypothetical protein